MSGLNNYLRVGTLLCCGLMPWGFAAEGRAQGTAWAPSRSASRPSFDSQSFHTSATPDWQRTPTSSNVRPTSHFAPRYSNAPTAMRTSHDNLGYPSRSSSSRGNTQRLNYDVQLGPGEQLVGQPTYSEPNSPSGSSRSTRTGAKEEFVPMPDGVSSGEQLPQETIRPGTSHRHDADGDVHLGPDFNYEEGEFGSEEIVHEHDGSCHDGHCDSCVGGDCDSCTGGFGHGLRDEWADPTACTTCGGYGYHRIGCGRVAMCLHNCLGPLVREWSIFTGVQGFKGPLDNGTNGNFGFNEGFNFAGPMIPWPRVGVGYQIGARFAQSNLSGSPLNTSSREQAFITAGMYHRAYRGFGFQWGVVYDWLSDNYLTNGTYAQMRAEMSWLGRRGHEFGFLGMFGVKDKNNALAIPVTQADQYNWFYRHTTAYGSQARLWLGMTGNNSLAILGSDFRVPMSNRCEFVGGFNYIIPNDGNAGGGVMGGFTQESWGLAMNLVWYVGRPKQGVHNTPFRPLFNVADNNVMMFERQ